MKQHLLSNSPLARCMMSIDFLFIYLSVYKTIVFNSFRGSNCFQIDYLEPCCIVIREGSNASSGLLMQVAKVLMQVVNFLMQAGEVLV